MTSLIRSSAAFTIAILLATSVLSQTARTVRGASPYTAIQNEPAPKLVVDPPLSEALTKGAVQIQYRVENIHIVPVFGAGALDVSPRLGHLHITVDDLPWLWADASDSNTIDFVGSPAGEHAVLIELVDPTHHVFSGCDTCRRRLTFTVPATASRMH
jgi:hypothetical protein